MTAAIGRRLLTVGLVVAVVGLAVPAARAEDVVKMGDLPALSSAGLYVAIEKGYFAERGLRVETDVFASGAKMTPALATGEIDVATGALSAALVNGIAGGMDFKIVADKGQVRPGFAGTMLVVRKDLVDSGQVRSAKDLRGRTVAIGAKGIVLDYLLAKTMEDVGLTYDSLNVTYLAYPDAIKALATKAIDAVWTPEPWGARAEAQGVGVRFVLPDQVKAISTFQIGVIIYAGKFMRERPRVARDFLAAYVKGVRFHNERGAKDPEVMAIVSKHTKVPVEAIKASHPFWLVLDGKLRGEDLMVVQDFFLDKGWIKAKLPLERLVDQSFLQ